MILKKYGEQSSWWLCSHKLYSEVPIHQVHRPILTSASSLDLHEIHHNTDTSILCNTVAVYWNYFVGMVTHWHTIFLGGRWWWGAEYGPCRLILRYFHGNLNFTIFHNHVIITNSILWNIINHFNGVCFFQSFSLFQLIILKKNWIQYYLKNKDCLNYIYTYIYRERGRSIGFTTNLNKP